MDRGGRLSGEEPGDRDAPDGGARPGGADGNALDGDALLEGVALTRETPAPGVVVWQPKRGYRYGVEVYALAAFALRGGDARTAVDLGCGSGVVGLLLASKGVAVRAVDRDPRWVALARRSAAASGFPVAVEQADVRTLAAPPVDLAVTNPPWFPPDEPVPPDPWKAGARAMLHGDVRAFVEAGLRLAPRVCVVTRVERERDLAGLWIARRATLGAKVLLVEVRPADARPAGTATVEEPVDVDGAYRLFRGAGA